MDGLPTVDSLMPRQMAERAEDVGVAKARLDVISTLLLGILAGAFIGLGGAFSTVAVTGAGGVLPFGVTRVIAGVTFCLGLMLVIIAGAELFTGNNLLLMAFASRKISALAVLRNWCIVYFANFLGAAATAMGLYFAALHTLDASQVGKVALGIAQAKCMISWTEALFRGIYCNALVCLAVWICMSCRTTGDKILAGVFPVAAFVAAGMEHSVANMYFVPAAIFIRDWAPPSFWAQIQGVPADYAGVTWTRFLVSNLVPVTLGNIIGGAVFVGATYWVIYCRRRPQ